MPVCPKCHANQAEDYGMVTCPQCGTILFIDLEGIAQIGSTPEPHEEAPTVPEPSTPVDLEPPTPEPIPEPDNFPILQFDTPKEQETAPQATSLDQSISPIDAMLSAEAHAIEQGVGSNPADTLNLNEYANSELSQGKNGAFVYQLVFEGIDSKEIREAVRQELDDSRFGWDTHALLNGVQGGKLVIERLSAIKASILVNRLKRLPLKIKWQQFSITELDS